MSAIKLAIGKNLSWLSTMKTPFGYAGPVVHYWSNSLDYIGPGTDWRYEGLISAFLILHEKTGEKRFLDSAIKAGEFILANRRRNGGFFFSSFEANPSFEGIGTPHQSAVVLALIRLADRLKSLGLEYKKFSAAALENLEKIHMEKLWSKEQQTFFQYGKSRAAGRSNAFVPNKIATACQAFFAMYRHTKQKRFLDIGLTALAYVPSMQCTDNSEWFGGIFQSDDQNKVFSYYTARCIPALAEGYELSQQEMFRRTIENALVFLGSMQNPDGSHNAGFMRFGSVYQKTTLPHFAAGAGDIGLALEIGKPFGKADSRGVLEWVMQNAGKSGGFFSARGLEYKNRPDAPKKAEYSWQDALPVVGWNDKALHFLSSVCRNVQDIPKIEFEESQKQCSNGTLIETRKLLAVEGAEKNWRFEKQKNFSNDPAALKNLFCRIGLLDTPPTDWVARAGLRILRDSNGRL
ncbi:MAG: prenyltransferase/squalene oxidase repeat-containing protein [Candidatus Micrarchaeota archaeon]